MHTIVSAYYKIPSKQPHSYYIPLLHRWFRSISAPVLFFTSSELHKELKSLDILGTNVTIIELEFTELNAWKLGRDFWDRQKQRDVEQYHTPELAAVWFEKKEFVLRAMEYTDANTFIWCDAGCIRDDTHEHLAKQFGKRDITLDDNKLHLQYIRDQPVKPFYVYPEYRIAGAIIGGNRNAWKHHAKLYDSVIRYYDDNKVCCNMDQYIIQSCTDQEPNAYSFHRVSNTYISNPWFFFLETL